jgi:hypothetical protein
MVKFIELDGTIYNIEDILRISRTSYGKSEIYVTGSKERFWRAIDMPFDELKSALGYMLYDPSDTPRFKELSR